MEIASTSDQLGIADTGYAGFGPKAGAVCKKWMDARAFGHVFAYAGENGGGDGKKKASDTMGMKHRVDHGVYICYGSMNPQLADKTGFPDGDASAIKDALISLFRNDESSARPAGSREVVRSYSWEHNSNIGQYSPAKVHRSLAERVCVKDGASEPTSIGEYVLPEKDEIEQALPGLTCLVIDGE